MSISVNLKRALFFWWLLRIVVGVGQSIYLGHSVVAEPIFDGFYYVGFYFFCQLWRTKDGRKS